MVSKRELLECFGSGAESGYYVARNRRAAGLDESELTKTLKEDWGGEHPDVIKRAEAYVTGFRIGWGVGWVSG